MEQVDPFKLAMDFLQSPEALITFGFPLALLIAVIVFGFLLYQRKKKAEVSFLEDLTQEVEKSLHEDGISEELNNENSENYKRDEAAAGGKADFSSLADTVGGFRNRGPIASDHDSEQEEEREGEETGADSAITDEEVEAYEKNRDKAEEHAEQDQAQPEQRQPLQLARETKDQAEANQLADDVQEIKSVDQPGWLKRLKIGLSSTRNQFSKGLSALFSSARALDNETLDKVHELLYRADVGVATADTLVAHLKQNAAGVMDWKAINSLLQGKVEEILTSAQKPLNTAQQGEPFVILVVGVNGVGKTTSIGKLAAHFISQGKSVLLAAGDTYRAAAIEQLKVWGDRLQVEVIAHQQGSDPAAVAFDAVKAAKARSKDVLLIDTAGRLHNKDDLMNELSKINKAIKKELPNAPHETWLVLDATTGQNAFVQVKAFSEVVNLSGLVVTKLDGTAKGGVVIGIGNQFKMPIRYIGVGEKAADLRQFNPADYAHSLFEID